MKLGLFDSGLGGLVIARAVHEALPDLDKVYLGDTLRVPYGGRSTQAVYNFTRRAMIRLFDMGCVLVIIACNTASAAALRHLQQVWLPEHYPDRNILGVIVPTLEEATAYKPDTLGLIGTHYIVNAGIYKDELEKIAPDIELVQNAAPLLVPLIENDGLTWADPIVAHYLAPLIKADIKGLILGCTHYPLLKTQIQKALGPDVRLVSQDDIIPDKLRLYLSNHPEYEGCISKTGRIDFYVTDLTDNYLKMARDIYGDDIAVQTTDI